MAATRRTVFLVAMLAICALGLSGCDKGLRVGDTYIIKAKAPQSASRIEVSRIRTGYPDHIELNQKLSIDLTSGRASLTDTDGKVYPSQVEATRVEMIRNGIGSRSWQVGKLSPPKHATDVTRYHLTVFDKGAAIKPQASWSVPSKKAVPDVLTLIMDSFDRADRVAHPLSDKVDLTQ